MLMRFVVLVAAVMLSAVPAKAQFFLKPADLRGAPATGAETEVLGITLPDAKPEEHRAALVWAMRSALNVAALQCGFAPTLLTVENYNAMLRDHKEELASSYASVNDYFKRVHKNERAARTAFDSFSTRVYSGFSTVSAQLTFCMAADSIGRDVLFAPRGQLFTVAEGRMRELRSSLRPYGEQQFRTMQAWTVGNQYQVPAAFGQKSCWKKNVWQEKRCGPPFRGELPKRRG